MSQALPRSGDSAVNKAEIPAMELTITVEGD